MIQPHTSPIPEDRLPVPSRPRPLHDDLDIPAPPGSAQMESPHRTRRAGVRPSAPRTLLRTLRAGTLALLAAGLLGGLAAGVWSTRGAYWGPETSYRDWEHVAAASQASAGGGNWLTHVNASGHADATLAVMLSRADVDHETTRAVRTALLSNNLAAAEQAFRAAQPPGLISKTDSPGLASDANLLNAIRDGRAEFFHLRVSDSCAEDNDILHVSVNGVALGEAPLTHHGMVFSVPVIPGTTTVTLQGVHDGGGGITMKFESSEGHYFCHTIAVGDEIITWIVIP